MHVVARPLQISWRRTVYDQGLVAAAEQMAEQLVAEVEPSRVSAQKPFHARNQVRLGRLEHQVKMIRHEAIGMNLPARLAARLAQGLDNPLAVVVVVEDRFAPVPTVHNVVQSAGALELKLLRHTVSRIPSARTGVKRKLMNSRD